MRFGTRNCELDGMAMSSVTTESVVIREIKEDERDFWDEEVQRFGACHPFNAYDWGNVRGIDGWVSLHLMALRGESVTGVLLLLKKKLPFVPFWIFYGPKGPVCDFKDRETVVAFHRRLVELAEKENAILVRIDPNLKDVDAQEFNATMRSLGYTHLDQRWTFWNSPRDVYRIDLDSTDTPDQLLSALDRDTRRCIRKAARDGVTIVPAMDEDDLRKFYGIFEQFSVSKGFLARGYAYQRELWNRYVARGRGRLFIARHGGEVIGGLLCIAFGRKCLAMHMGTPYKYQRLQSYYAYVWDSIRWAKDIGCVWYSFRGVGTTPTQEAFKRKFNPRAVALAGYYDFAFRPLLYRLFHWTEFWLLPRAWPVIIMTRRIARRIGEALGVYRTRSVEKRANY